MINKQYKKYLFIYIFQMFIVIKLILYILSLLSFTHLINKTSCQNSELTPKNIKVKTKGATPMWAYHIMPTVNALLLLIFIASDSS